MHIQTIPKHLLARIFVHVFSGALVSVFSVRRRDILSLVCKAFYVLERESVTRLSLETSLGVLRIQKILSRFPSLSEFSLKHSTGLSLPKFVPRSPVPPFNFARTLSWLDCSNLRSSRHCYALAWSTGIAHIPIVNFNNSALGVLGNIAKSAVNCQVSLCNLMLSAADPGWRNLAVNAALVDLEATIIETISVPAIPAISAEPFYHFIETFAGALSLTWDCLCVRSQGGIVARLQEQQFGRVRSLRISSYTSPAEQLEILSNLVSWRYRTIAAYPQDTKPFEGIVFSISNITCAYPTIVDSIESDLNVALEITKTPRTVHHCFHPETLNRLWDLHLSFLRGPPQPLQKFSDLLLHMAQIRCQRYH